MYVIDRPRELGALFLVDPSHEDMPDRFAAGMPERERLEWIEQRSVPNSDGIREVSLDARLRRLRTPRIPVTVLTAAQRSGSEGWDSRFISEASRQLHAEILQGAAVPRDQPQLVVDEILRLRGFLER